MKEGGYQFMWLWKWWFVKFPSAESVWLRCQSNFSISIKWTNLWTNFIVSGFWSLCTTKIIIYSIVWLYFRKECSPFLYLVNNIIFPILLLICVIFIWFQPSRRHPQFSFSWFLWKKLRCKHWGLGKDLNDLANLHLNLSKPAIGLGWLWRVSLN